MKLSMAVMLSAIVCCACDKKEGAQGNHDNANIVTTGVATITPDSDSVAPSLVFYLVVVIALMKGTCMAWNSIVNYIGNAAYGKAKITIDATETAATWRKKEEGKQEKRMYWMRHGDSTWNGVMDNLMLGKGCRLDEFIGAQMSSKSKHINAALSDEGIQQVVGLGKGGRVHQQESVAEGKVSLPDVYVVSPMRRTVQTFAGAVAGFAQQNNLEIETSYIEKRLALRYKSNGEQRIETKWIFIQFDADIREIKKLATERDCIGTDNSKTIKGMLQHAKLNACHYLAETAESIEMINSLLDELSKHADDVAFHGTMQSGTNKKGVWWNHNAAEPEISYKKRLSGFMSRCPDNAAIFSHSFTIKMVAKYFIDLNSLTVETGKAEGEWLAKNKVFNTGGMHLGLQEGRAANEGKVVHVSFVGEGQQIDPPNKKTISDYLKKAWTRPHGTLTREQLIDEIEMQDMTKKRLSHTDLQDMPKRARNAPELV